MERQCKKCGTTEKVNFDGMCKKCYEDSIVIHENEPENIIQNKKSFWKDKKNIAIVILSFILLCFLCSSDKASVEKNNDLSRQLDDNKAQIAELKQKLEESSSQITVLQAQKEKLQNENQRLQENDSQTTELQASNQTLQTEKETLEAQKNQLEQEKVSLQTQNQELSTKIQELQSTSTSKTTQTTSVSSAPTTNINSETVYITDTGKKYHSGGCSYLKSSKHEISKSNAIAQGYTPCSKCKP